MSQSSSNVSTLGEAGTRVTGTGAGVQTGMFGPLDTPEVRQAIRQTYERIAKLETERDHINAKIKAERESLVNRGLDRDGVKDGVRRAKMNTEKRADYDQAYLITRDVMDAPLEIQPPPDDDEEEEAEAPEKKPAAKPGARAPKH